MIGRCISILVVWAIFLLAGCKKESLVITNNNAPWYDEIPTGIIENYVNRMYIDLIGREPLHVEMNADVEYLKASHLISESRDSLIRKLQLNTEWRDGDSSYKYAYYHKLYELTKVRLVEGAANGEFQLRIGIALNGALVDSLNGDSVSMAIKKEIAAKLQVVIDAEDEYREGLTGLNDMCGRMINNSVYDQINMNTFNYIRATYNDLFLRYPSQSEYDQAFNMIEYNVSGILFASSGQNKGDYVQILVNSREFYEGLIRWAYLTLMAREAKTTEVSAVIAEFYFDHDFQKVQRKIMVTDEYANFK